MMIISEYDLRQIRLIKKKINLFENKEIGLSGLVCDLRGLLCAIESADESWKDSILTEINRLELVHDSIEDRSILKWKEDAKNVVRESILTLKKMISLLFEAYLRLPDPTITESAVVINTHWLMCPKCADTWESNSTNAMVICPNCNQAFRNPRF